MLSYFPSWTTRNHTASSTSIIGVYAFSSQSTSRIGTSLARNHPKKSTFQFFNMQGTRYSYTNLNNSIPVESENTRIGTASLVTAGNDEDNPSSKQQQSWQDKIAILASNSQTFQSLSLQEQLGLVEELLENVQCLGDDERFYWNDMTVLKLGPPPAMLDNVSHDGKYSSHVKKFMGMNKFAMISLVVTSLKSIKASLEYQINKQSGSRRNNIPSLLRNVRTENIGGKPINIHGPVELFPMFHKMEVWSDANVDNPPPHDTKAEKDIESLSLGRDQGNDVALVLGAGNQSFITILDCLQCLFYHPRKPVFIKHHPLRPYLHLLISELFAPLIQRGYLDQVQDRGLEETQSILSHLNIGHVHVTGALSTAHAIKEKLKESWPELSGEDMENMVTSELGCATPWIIVPGKYSKSELKMAAKHIVTGKKMNSGCNCLCSQVVILPHDWDQKDEFKQILFEKIEEIPTDPLYYPGSLDRLSKIIGKYEPKNVQQIMSHNVDRNYHGDDTDFVQTYVVDCGVYGKDGFNDYALKNEAFGPILALVELPGNGNGETYLMGSAVPFVNHKENIYGSLSCSIVYPKKYNKEIIKEATAELNYGCVALNTWSFYGYFGIAYGGAWGGSKYDVTGQSGKGLIGNYFLIPDIQKTVVRSRALTFPLIVDKMFLPPKFIMDIASKFFLRKRYFKNLIRKVIK
jgi:acyl-CoA reductase-like NAD-dependent aldehyde dehydrogenase